MDKDEGDSINIVKCKVAIEYHHIAYINTYIFKWPSHTYKAMHDELVTVKHKSSHQILCDNLEFVKEYYIVYKVILFKKI